MDPEEPPRERAETTALSGSHEEAAPAVSVIICVRNGETTLRQQLDALAAQRDAPPFDVVIVDNGCTDRTRDVVREWIGAGIGPARDAFMVDASDQTGISFARNVGAASSTGAILAYCDADDVVGPRWVAALFAAAQSGAEAITGTVLELALDPARTGATILDAVPSIVHQAGSTAPIPMFWGCNFALTRQVYERVGGFDAGMPPYGCDDSETSVRLSEAGVGIQFAPDMQVAYRLATGTRRLLTRQYRSGVAEPAQWARHPRVFPRPPSLGQLLASLGRPLASIVTAPIGRSQDQPLRARIFVAAQDGAHALGTFVGTLALRRGRFATPLLYTAGEDARPSVPFPAPSPSARH